jgi:CheY-like chemotaxis protein
MSTSVLQPLTVVLGEDDDGHALLIRKNLQRAGFVGPIVRMADGRAVLDYFRDLERRGELQGREMLLLLDIHMPHVGGIEVLRQLKTDPETELVPVIMLTTTDDPREIARCYGLGCNIYVSKPVVYERFVDAISRLANFLAVVRAPSQRDRGN